MGALENLKDSKIGQLLSNAFGALVYMVNSESEIDDESFEEVLEKSGANKKEIEALNYEIGIRKELEKTLELSDNFSEESNELENIKVKTSRNDKIVNVKEKEDRELEK